MITSIPFKIHTLFLEWKIRVFYGVLNLGDLKDEDKVLAWLTDDDTLEIPDQIEEVNTKMLEKILDTSEHVAVFFCRLFFSLSYCDLLL